MKRTFTKPIGLRRWIQLSIVSVVAAFVVGAPLSAQDQAHAQAQKHHRYRFVDIGTLGGPASYSSGQGAGSVILNNAGAVAGSADTALTDPNSPICWDDDCYLAHAVRWQNGTLIDLGALPGGNNSAINGMNARGWIAGTSQSGLTDPILGIPAFVPVLWKGGRLINLGTLGGYMGVAEYVNDAGQAVGFSTVDTTPDPFSFLGAAVHAYIWENGEMRDLGTLGGPDSVPGAGGVNQRRGLVVGWSYTNSIPNPVTGVPTAHPFLWENGSMTDLGTLGGTNCCYDMLANSRRQVAGDSNLAGDLTYHPFFWERGVMTDIGTFGGSNGQVSWINEAGEVVGVADLPGDQQHDAFFWKNGVLTDLGNLGQTSYAFCVNAKHQVVGSSLATDGSYRAFLWESGGPMIDLNTLAIPTPGLVLSSAFNINDRGEIAGVTAPPGCTNTDACGRLFILIPCIGDQADATGCVEGTEAAQASDGTMSSPPPRRLPRRDVGPRSFKLRRPGSGPAHRDGNDGSY